MPRILACTACVDDWKAFLARPDRQWKDKYSAKSLATSWEHADGLPAEVAKAMAACPDGGLADPKPFLAIPEFRVDLPGGERASQTDLMVIGRAKGGPFVMAVEGKVKETFGETIKEWKKKASDGRKERWRFIRRVLGLDQKPAADLRYQLFHRAVSAVLTARRCHSPIAVFLVQSFSSNDEGFGDFEKFVALFGKAAAIDSIVPITRLDETQLYAGWVRSPTNNLRGHG